MALMHVTTKHVKRCVQIFFLSRTHISSSLKNESLSWSIIKKVVGLIVSNCGDPVKRLLLSETEGMTTTVEGILPPKDWPQENQMWNTPFLQVSCRIFGVNSSKSFWVQTSKESLWVMVNYSTVTVIISPVELLVAWCKRQLFTHEYAKVGKKTVGMIWSQQYLISVCKIKCLPCKVLCTESYQCKTSYDDFFKLWSFVPLFFACWHVLWKLCREMGRGRGERKGHCVSHILIHIIKGVLAIV